MSKIGIENGKYIMPEKVAGSVTPTEQLTDGDFDNQNTFENPDGFTMFNILADSVVEDSFAKSITAQAGSYALELTCAYFDGDSTYLSPAPGFFDDSVTGGETVQSRFYARQLSGSNSAVAVAQFFYDDFSGNDYVYNLTAGDWVEKNGGSDDGNNHEVITLSGGATYTQYASTQRTLPANNPGVLQPREAWAEVVFGSTVQSETGLLDGLEFLVDAADVLTEGGFENWTDYTSQITPLDDWTFLPGGNWEFTPDIIEESDYISFTTDGADNVLKFTVWNSSIGPDSKGFVYQSITESAATEVDLSVYTKTSDSQTPYLVLLDGIPGAHTQAYNFSTEGWQANTDAPGLYPGGPLAKTLSGTGSFVENTHTATIPSSGFMYILLMSDSGNEPTGQYTFEFKTPSATIDEVTPGSSFVGLDASSASDVDDLEDTDYIEKIHTTGGTPATLWGLLKTGEVESDVLSNIDFDTPGITISAADPTTARHLMTKAYAESVFRTKANVESDIAIGSQALLQTTFGIDLKSTGQTEIYEVPAGYKFIIAGYTWETTTATAAVGDAVISFGTAAGSYTDVVNSPVNPDTGLTVSQVVNYSGGTAIVSGGESGTPIYINVSVADSGTAWEATLYLFGTLIPEA